jgi:hypothetical protein
MNWTNIQIEICYPEWNGRRMLFRQCQASDVRPLRPPMLGVETIRCSSDAGYFVSRTNPEKRTYTDAMCERHAKQWGPLQIQQEKNDEAKLSEVHEEKH